MVSWVLYGAQDANPIEDLTNDDLGKCASGGNFPASAINQYFKDLE